MAATSVTLAHPGDGFETTDLQGLLASGFGKLRAAAYLVLNVRNPGRAKAWMRELATRLTTAEGPASTTAVNIALTHSGLRQLGLSPALLHAFPTEFAEGMVSEHRSRMLGDVGESAPGKWRWGGEPSNPVDVLLMLFALDPPTVATLQREMAGDLSGAGLEIAAELGTYDLGAREHFGFRDGISQPAIEGFGRPAPWKDSVQAGELVLGYPNEYGLYAPRPLVPPDADPDRILPSDPEGSGAGDFGRNGTYLVFRQLRQDVAGFWSFAAAAALRSGQGSPVKLASKMVGRWPSGAPLVRSPEEDTPELAQFNDFAYGNEDRSGLRCPVGAHIRRANPRDSLDPSPGTNRSVALVKRHRVLRRGRDYGPPLGDPSGPRPPLLDDGQERGLHFICLNADLVRQFEFVQATWVASPKFDGLYDDADPLVASRGASGSTFTIPDQAFRHRLLNLPQFVTAVGGGYFFMPGIRAIRYLAATGARGA